jgi:hypothetical protein
MVYGIRAMDTFGIGTVVFRQGVADSMQDFGPQGQWNWMLFCSKQLSSGSIQRQVKVNLLMQLFCTTTLLLLLLSSPSWKYQLFQLPILARTVHQGFGCCNTTFVAAERIVMKK